MKVQLYIQIGSMQVSIGGLPTLLFLFFKRESRLGGVVVTHSSATSGSAARTPDQSLCGEVGSCLLVPNL